MNAVEMVSSRKVLWHREKVAAYLAGKPFLPVTLELGLTTVCNLSCPDCPSRRGRSGLFLSADMAKRLFSLCSGSTFGAILTGGEPTLHPEFGAILAAAREHGFRELAVISNGSRLDCEETALPLLAYASVVRVSLYDWQESAPPGFSQTLKRIERLRARIEKAGSGLQIGTSLLTGGTNRKSLARAAAAIRAAGAHWLYLHPTCVATPKGANRANGQQRLLSALESCRREQPPGFAVHYLARRFSTATIAFKGYHAAHFIMVVGADGDNYLSSETKYQPSFRIADSSGYADDDFFRKRERLQKIASVHSSGYAALSSRNRGVLYNHVLEAARLDSTGKVLSDEVEFLLPHIL